MALMKGKKIKHPYLFVLGGFRLGPGSDISRTSPSRGENLCLGVGASEMGFRLIPHFALGPITDVTNSASAGRDSLMLRVDNVDGWFNVRGPGLSDISITSPSSRVIGGLTSSEIAWHSRGRSNSQQLYAKNEWEQRDSHGWVSSRTDSMPSEGTVRLAPRPRSRLISRSSGPREREVDEGRILPNPPLPNWKRYNNEKRSDQLKSHAQCIHRHHREPHTPATRRGDGASVGAIKETHRFAATGEGAVGCFGIF